MRKFVLLSLAVIAFITATSQDFSNKGKDFWVGYGFHTSMLGGGGGSQDMVLYFATDQVTNITITIPANGYTQTLTSVAGNNILTSFTVPKFGAQDSRLLVSGLSNNGIHITSDKPMVAYAHVYNGNCSGATILFPVNTLGKEYYSMNFKNVSNLNNANCWFYVMAVDTGTTSIEITPVGSQIGVITTNGWSSGTTYTVNLTQGQIFNVMGILTSSSNPFTGVDLTGSKIKSIASGSGGCKKIAVFSGSGRISITCNNNSSSSDNYMVQAMPQTAWGKKYLTVPASGNQSFNYYRIGVSDPTTIVRINGVVTALPLINNFYYEIAATNLPLSIESDKPVTVAQYFTSQGSCGNGTAPANPGDPEVIYLSSVEQNIAKVIWNATNNFNITNHYFNAVIKNTGTALTSFRLNGVAVPPASFIVHPQDPSYSYLRQTVVNGFNIIQSDSGFNAIAYGFGSAESYGYNAGTNVRDLTQQLELETTYGIETSPSVCTNAPFKFKVYFPDSTATATPVEIRYDSLRWRLTNGSTIVPNNFPVLVPGTVGSPPYVAIDSTNTRNGRQVNWYSLPTTYSFNAAGRDTLIITAYRSTNEGCGTSIEYEFPIDISDPPTASFNVPQPGCFLDSVRVTETTPQLPKATYKQWWEFYDPVTNTTTVYSGNGLRYQAHQFTTPGVKQIRHASITTPGCLSDTIVQNVTLPELPDATITGNTTPVCINTLSGPDVTFTGTLGTPQYVFSYTIDDGTGPGPIQTVTSFAGGTITIQHPTTVAGTFTYNLVSVRNVGAAVCTQNITGQSVTVTITADATIALTSGAGTDNQTLCINTPLLTNITYAVGGTGNGGSVSGLPAGLTGVYAGGVITISGTPTVAGVFPYTVSTTGPCVTPTATGTITVTGDGTLSLSSAAGSDNQTLCINTPLLINITYAVGGTGTGGSVAGLPAGVTGVFALGTITISGTPTVAGVFNYTVSTTGPCVVPTATGTITVTADGTLTLTSAPATTSQSLCINVPITDITYAVGGTGTGGSVSGLPTGVTGVYAAGVITISGTPTALGTFSYTVNTTGPCVTPSLGGTITVNPDAAINLTSAGSTAAQNLCRNSTIANITYSITGGGTGGTVSGLPAGVTGVFAAGVVTISGTPTVAGLFNYTVNTSGTCVQASATGYINVYQLPTAAFTSTAPLCETRVIDFTDVSTANTGTVTNWQWNFGDPGSGAANTSALQNPSHVFSTAGSYTVTLTVTTDSGCVSNPIASTPIIINNRPEAGFIVPDVCINDVATPFTDTSKVAVGTINRPLNEWNYGDPGSGVNNTSVGQNGLHLYTATGVYQVTQIVTSNTGCRDTIVLPITINSADPVSNFNITNSGALCSSDSVSLVNTSTVGFGNVTRLEIYWDNVGAPGTFQTIMAPTFNGVYKHKYPTLQTTQSYEIRMIAYSGVICSNERITTITVHANPRVQFNNIPDICYISAPYQITQASEIGGVPGSGTFSGPGVSPTGLFTASVAGIGTHTIRYTFTSSSPGACIDTLDNTITVLDTAHAAFTVVMPSCEQVPTMFTDISTAPPTVVLSNTVWDFGDGTPLESHAPGSTFGHMFAAPGTYTVTMHNVSAVGCLSTDTSAVITIDANHSISLSSANDNQTVCINTPIADIVYALGGGANDVAITGLPAGLTATVTGGNTLTISGSPTTTVGSPFRYDIVTTGNTCVVADTFGIITVEPDHTITLTSNPTTIDQSVCVNTPIDNITYDLGGGASGPVTFTPAALPPGITSSVTGNVLTISGTPTSTTGGPVFNYTITTNGNGCVRATTSFQIKVNPFPVPGFTVDKPSYCVPNAIVGFINGSTMPDGSGMTYVWNFGDGSPLNTGVNPSHWFANEGPFNVNLSVASTAVLNGGAIGCTHDTTIAITTIHPQPKTDFTFDKPTVCAGDNVTITDNTDYKDGVANLWSWDLGDGTTRSIRSFSHTYADTITYDITLFTVNSHGCNSDTLTKTFTVNPYPHVNAGPDRFILEGGQITLESVTFANDPQYLWTPNLYLLNNTVAQPRVIKPLTDMTYRLTVTARGGCARFDDVFVKLLKFPVIPNTFTPNNDGINDTWRIDYLNTYPDNRVQIFTRSGQLVFQSRGYNTPWDGTMKGKPLPLDTYYYIIEPGSGRDPVTGYVTIIK